MQHLLVAHKQVLSPHFFQAKSLLLPKPGAKGSTPKPHGPNSCPSLGVPTYSAKAAWSSLVWLLSLGLNPGAGLSLQPHFWLPLQSVTPASIPVFFQLSWAAIVSLGRCGPMAWSQSSPSSHAGSVTRKSCFPATSWVEVTPIPLSQSKATAI